MGFILISRGKRTLIESFLSLSTLQAANYILPLITLPYLVRVLGPSQFGRVAFAAAIIQYFSLLPEYGFNLSAVREVSICRDDKIITSELFNAVMVCKLLLLLVSAALCAFLVWLIPKFRGDWALYLFSFGQLFGAVLFPTWFYCGMEKMRYITILNVFGKLIFTIAVFIFIRKSDDYLYVPLLTSLGFIIPGILGLWLAYRWFGLQLRLPMTGSVISQYKQGWQIFVQTIAVSLYTTSSTVILGFFASNTIIGYYSAADKIIRSAQQMLMPAQTAIYPHISKLAHLSKERALIFLRKVSFLIGSIALAISCCILIFAKPVVLLLFGKAFHESISIMHILSFLPFLSCLSYIFGVQIMLTFGLQKILTRVLMSASFINVVIALLLAPSFKAIGVATTILFVESFITASLLICLVKKNIFSVHFILTGKFE